MNFQKIILVIASILLILTLIIFGVSIYNQKYNTKYPPVIAQCPDYWISKAGSNNKNEVCQNVKNLGNPNCDKTVNFSLPEYSGSDGICKKKKWANNCNITWDGITNSTVNCNY